MILDMERISADRKWNIISVSAVFNMDDFLH